MKRFPTKALAAVVVLFGLLTACATMGPPQPPSLDLPKPPADLRATRKGDKVLLSWTIPTITTDRHIIRSLGPTRICRGLEAQLIQCGTPVSEATTGSNITTSRKQKTMESYTDELPGELVDDNPSRFITYAIEVLKRDGRGAGLSNQVRIPLARTLPPPQDFHAQVTSQGVVLSWTSSLSPAPAEAVHYVYRLYRTPEGTQQSTLIGDIAARGQRDLSLTDSSIEWEKTYQYRVETVTVIAAPGKPEVQIEGDNSPEIKVFADDVFPPAVPSGLQAVFSGPGQKPFIDLVWAPVTDVDLDGYNVYRREEGPGLRKVNVELVKTPAYRDADVTSGKRYFYSVSAVDVRGNESARSQESEESVP